MKENTVRYFTRMVHFLGGVLGPDYEVSMYDLEAEGYPVIAIANASISGQTIGDPLPDVIQQLIQADGEREDMVLHMPVRLQRSGKTIRTSAMLIRDERGQAVGLLGINFDDRRYLDLCGELLKLIHPDGFVEEQYAVGQWDQPGQERAAAHGGRTVLHNDVGSLVQELFEETAQHWPIPLERLTQEERMAVILQLRRRGMFRLKGAVQYTARRLACSPASIYRYLNKIARAEDRGGEPREEG